ncbi:Cytochrome c oxidase assembly factor 3, mitochondrial [Batrachochytrium dendrobatidis]|nr:Cytochrome c oxidase assembly factor 3, mitochondrial [Batrachochytrium dendrobatidis]OAJ43623.1 hypothetical protein BDEG_26965 [Batrachochytrium dendrobatidis JEL423]
MSAKPGSIKRAAFPVDQTAEHIRHLEQTMTPEELRKYKLQILRPYRTRNMVLSMGLFGSVAAIYAYTMYKMRPDDFNKLETIEKFKNSGK